MLNDLRFAFRALRNQPSFVLVAVCSLAIGIGANTAVYSFADTLLLRPMPVWKPSQVVDVTQATDGSLGASTSVSYPDYVDLRSQNGSFSAVVASALAPFGLAPDHKTQPRALMSMFVSGNFFDAMRVAPQLGRGFAPREDAVPGRDAVVVLSHSLWTSDFASDSNIVGRKVVLNGVDFTVIGVAPEQFTSFGQFKPAMYVPLAMAVRLWEPAMLTDRARRWLDVRARLKPGVSLQQAGADVSRITAALRRSYPATDSSLHLRAETELQLRAEQSPPDTALVIMLGLLALCVLLIACANVAGLLVSRSAGRAREIAVRLAIGGSRSALIRQLLIENLYIAIAGGSVGLLIALGATRFFNSLPIDMPVDFNFRLDDRALLFTFAISVLSTLLFGLARHCAVRNWI